MLNLKKSIMSELDDKKLLMRSMDWEMNPSDCESPSDLMIPVEMRRQIYYFSLLRNKKKSEADVEYFDNVATLFVSLLPPVVIPPTIK
jgi:hypothetical protein